ncbi:colanic acid/amylovoran biosynthesis protein [Oceanotoga teriensis]|uniref:Colanic acid/amylovoran biosynthesis protein n=1 Tax=Oceanotoga teriensis TaxID=515440 RepID=A0AA45HJ68_9BACT|nr:polysaccharide pyruvyl transferase family protein [Oceanotoga teriensis]PWJ95853.1 colanic acid/amylovoran biosynthesis protein [Oceanotoga teriensis]
MRILIIGQTTLHWGRMEFGNIGNYYIIEPFIRELHKTFENSEIKTTLQMSKRFCKDEKVESLPIDLYYGFNKSNNLELAKYELTLVEDYLKNGKFQEITPYIKEVLESDIVIDFSGDIWGDNANFLGKDRFEVGLYKDLIAQKLKPTYMIAGSPGPFKDIKTKDLAKKVYEGFDLVTNREPISSDIIKREGFNTNNTSDLACPAFLFEPINIEKAKEKEEVKNIFDKSKLNIGFVICGWNFEQGPFDKWPRDDKDYITFAKSIEHIANKYDVNIILMSHSNGFPIPPKKFKLQHGRDYPIIKQLEKILKDRGTAKNIQTIDGVYDAWTTKGIIGNLDLMISGRVHAAVAALSQKIPTVIIDYGHEPKAHKLKGFAKVCEMENYVADPSKENDLIQKIEKLLDNKDKINQHLNFKIEEVKQMAKNNFYEIKEHLKRIGVL